MLAKKWLVYRERFGMVRRARRYVSCLNALLWIVRPRRDKSRKVTDVVDLVVRQQARTKRGQIKPTVRRVLYTAIVKIETINVDVRL